MKSRASQKYFAKQCQAYRSSRVPHDLIGLGHIAPQALKVLATIEELHIASPDNWPMVINTMA